MKSLKSCLTFILLIILLKINIFSQESVSPYKGSIIAGTNRSFIISLNQQEHIKAKILSIDDDIIIIKERTGNTREVYRSDIKNIEEIPFGTRGNVGVGFGIPYGILGFNLELSLLPVLSVTGGFGTTIFTGVGYNVGLKGYLLKPGPIF